MLFVAFCLLCAIFALDHSSVHSRGSDMSALRTNEANDSMTPTTLTMTIVKQNDFNISSSRLVVDSITDMYKQLPVQIMRGTTQLLDLLWSTKKSDGVQG
uniref:AlNc14C216G9010 protein n=1 Tax=Albugo laibachii Nc14 TaxID=890382 RepID=F0WRK9_9STRA|nr:AlNc14C216G9010 [Albugo laibachii Nc14]|eukprot:CCA23973.1 AlNc14C216G9010 [Albugo laibachii Nc14]